ncbi:MAG: type III secretion system gatekeeper subunit SctW [Verrucomicrobiota bacterium]
MIDGIQSSRPHAEIAGQQQLADSGVTGSYRGQQVVVQDLQSLIAENAEEMTFFKSEEVEKKKLSERKGRSSENDVQKLKEIAEMMAKQIPDLGGKPKLDEFLEALKNQDDQSPDGLRRQAERDFPDLSHQYAALSYAMEALALDGTDDAKALVGSIRDLQATMMQERGPEITAGLNISADAARFEETGLDTTQNLRDFYRTSVVGYDNALTAFDGVMNKYGAEKFSEGLQFLIESIGTERGLNETSAPQEQLEASVNDLYFVQFIGNSDTEMRAILERTDRAFAA